MIFAALPEGSPNPPTQITRLSLRPQEAARALGIGQRLLWEKTNCGEIPCLRIGRCVLYPVALLQQWLADQASPTNQTNTVNDPNSTHKASKTKPSYESSKPIGGAL